MLRWLLRIWRQLPTPLKLLYLRLRYAHFGVGLAALIRDERGRILLVHRTYSKDEPWALPGGWLESGESVEGALQREMREETGLRIRVGPTLVVQRAGFALVVLLEAELLDPAANFRPSAEVSELGWFEPGEVGHLSRLNALLLARGLAPVTKA
jgi:ADP-ribose pyrophosphatase YjhB (NUDIX family)